MSLDPENLRVENNTDARRFELRWEDQVAFVQYKRAGDEIALTHSWVPKALGGRGLAARIVSHALDYARAQGLKVIPRCSFVVDYLRKHPEYHDLVPEAHRAALNKSSR